MRAQDCIHTHTPACSPLVHISARAAARIGAMVSAMLLLRATLHTLPAVHDSLEGAEALLLRAVRKTCGEAALEEMLQQIDEVSAGLGAGGGQIWFVCVHTVWARCVVCMLGTGIMCVLGTGTGFVCLPGALPSTWLVGSWTPACITGALATLHGLLKLEDFLGGDA